MTERRDTLREICADTWDAIARRRMDRGDQAGALRAWRAVATLHTADVLAHRQGAMW